VLASSLPLTRTAAADLPFDLRVGGAAVEIKADNTMKHYGGGRFFAGQDAPLRAVAVVVEKPGAGKVAIIGCDVIFLKRDLLDPVVEEIARLCGIPAAHILINATHTHHAPSTGTTHGGIPADPVFLARVGPAIVAAARQANERAANNPARFEFFLGEEYTVGQNSRVLLSDDTVMWIGRRDDVIRPTGPIDPQLPVLVFRGPEASVRAVIYGHSCHTIGTRKGNVISPGFYGVAAQELEAEVGAPICFLEGASGSTHNVGMLGPVPFDYAVKRLQQVLRDGLRDAAPRVVSRVAAIKRPFTYTIRKFDEDAEEAAVAGYLSKRVDDPKQREIRRAGFAHGRRALHPHQGQERTTWIQAMVIGEVAIVGVPAEMFTKLGLDIKQRSPFRETFIAELANDYVGYLPDREAFKAGGYQTWTGYHNFTEPGTGDRMVDEVIELLNELKGESGRVAGP